MKTAEMDQTLEKPWVLHFVEEQEDESQALSISNRTTLTWRYSGGHYWADIPL